MNILDIDGLNIAKMDDDIAEYLKRIALEVRLGYLTQFQVQAEARLTTVKLELVFYR